MTTTPKAFDLIPEDSWDEIGPLTAYAVYTVHDTFQDLLDAAPAALSSCITYRSQITDRWVLKRIDYYPTDDFFPPAAGHHYHPGPSWYPEDRL